MGAARLEESAARSGAVLRGVVVRFFAVRCFQVAMSRLTGCVMAAIWVVKCGWWAESVLVGMYAATGEPILGKGGCDPEFGGQEGCGEGGIGGLGQALS